MQMSTSVAPTRPPANVEHVKHALEALLALRAPDIALIAQALRISRRTLQRRLRGAGRTYVGLVAEVRQQTAERLLRDPSRKIADVARALGYSDHAHFTRAFLRWTGTSPREFRAGQRRAIGDERRASHPH